MSFCDAFMSSLVPIWRVKSRLKIGIKPRTTGSKNAKASVFVLPFVAWFLFESTSTHGQCFSLYTFFSPCSCSDSNVDSLPFIILAGGVGSAVVFALVAHIFLVIQRRRLQREWGNSSGKNSYSHYSIPMAGNLETTDEWETQELTINSKYEQVEESKQDTLRLVTKEPEPQVPKPDFSGPPTKAPVPKKARRISGQKSVSSNVSQLDNGPEACLLPVLVDVKSAHADDEVISLECGEGHDNGFTSVGMDAAVEKPENGLNKELEIVERSSSKPQSQVDSGTFCQDTCSGTQAEQRQADQSSSTEAVKKTSTEVVTELLAQLNTNQDMEDCTGHEDIESKAPVTVAIKDNPHNNSCDLSGQRPELGETNCDESLNNDSSLAPLPCPSTETEHANIIHARSVDSQNGSGSKSLFEAASASDQVHDDVSHASAKQAVRSTMKKVLRRSTPLPIPDEHKPQEVVTGLWSVGSPTEQTGFGHFASESLMNNSYHTIDKSEDESCSVYSGDTRPVSPKHEHSPFRKRASTLTTAGPPTNARGSVSPLSTKSVPLQDAPEKAKLRRACVSLFPKTMGVDKSLEVQKSVAAKWKAKAGESINRMFFLKRSLSDNQSTADDSFKDAHYYDIKQNTSMESDSTQAEGYDTVSSNAKCTSVSDTYSTYAQQQSGVMDQASLGSSEINASERGQYAMYALQKPGATERKSLRSDGGKLTLSDTYSMYSRKHSAASDNGSLSKSVGMPVHDTYAAYGRQQSATADTESLVTSEGMALGDVYSSYVRHRSGTMDKKSLHESEEETSMAETYERYARQRTGIISQATLKENGPDTPADETYTAYTRQRLGTGERMSLKANNGGVTEGDTYAMCPQSGTTGQASLCESEEQGKLRTTPLLPSRTQLMSTCSGTIGNETERANGEVTLKRSTSSEVSDGEQSLSSVYDSMSVEGRSRRSSVGSVYVRTPCKNSDKSSELMKELRNRTTTANANTSSINE